MALSGLWLLTVRCGVAGFGTERVRVVGCVAFVSRAEVCAPLGFRAVGCRALACRVVVCGVVKCGAVVCGIVVVGPLGCGPWLWAYGV